MVTSLLALVPTEIVLTILLFLPRSQLDNTQFACRRLDRIIRWCKHPRSKLHPPLYNATLSLWSSAFLQEVRLREQDYTVMVSLDMARSLLRHAFVKFVEVLGEPAPASNMRLYLRRLRRLRKHWSRSTVFLSRLPRDHAIGRVYIDQFTNAREIRLTSCETFTRLPITQNPLPDPIFNKMVTCVTQLYVRRCTLNDGPVFSMWMQIPRNGRGAPSGIRRVVVSR